MGSKVERQLEIVQQITHIGSWDWDIASGVVTWSDELYRIYGLVPRAREITFDVYLSYVHPEDRVRVAGEVRAALQAGRRFAHRERIVRPDGVVRELDTVGEVMFAPDGSPTCLIGTCRDITDEVIRDERLRLFAEIVDNMQIGLSVWRHDGSQLRLVASNVANERMTGIAITTSIGQSLDDCFPAAVGTELPQLLLDVETFQHPRREIPACRLARLPGAPVFAVKAFALPDRCVGLALEDVTLRVRAQRLHFAERRALEMLAAGELLADILAVIVNVIEELVPETLASILVVDETGTRLRHAASNLPADYTSAIDGAVIGPSAGSCGTAAFRRDAVFVTDIATDPLWADYRDIALRHGLRACWSSPILANDGHVLGTFAMYYKTPRRPEPSAVELISRAAHVSGIAIERRQLDAQLSALSARVEAAREDERTGIAREIHDVLGQALTALKIDIAWVARRKIDDPAVAEKLKDMTRTSDELIHAVQRISSELRPGILDDVGLQAAIEWQSEEIARRAGIPIEVRAELGDVQLERGFATAVFRIFQEAMTNVVRHAGAQHVVVELGLDRGRLRLAISDDGVGLREPVARNGALGLLGMRERAKRLGGECIVQRREVGGTVVSLIVPLRFPADAPLDTGEFIRPEG